MMIRWTPYNEMARLRNDFDQLFSLTGNRNAKAQAEAASTTHVSEETPWSPAVDIVEDKERILLSADLPGVSLEELELQVHKDVLSVKGTRKIERTGDPQAEQNGALFRRYERVAGAFLRTFTLPPTVDAERIEAAMKDGVLTLTLPKRPEAQPRQIKVQLSQ